MNQTLILELTDEVYRSLKEQADKAVLSVTHLITQKLQPSHELTPKLAIETEKELARKRFESHFGEIEIDNLTSLDNEKIDEDLAKEYANNHDGDECF